MFSAEECRQIIRAGEARNPWFAMIGNGGNNTGVINKDYRCVKASMLWRSGAEDLTWLYDRIARKVELANNAWFRFDLTGLGEAIQFLKYEVLPGDPPGHYDWHQDFRGGSSANRKLTVVVNLSDPADYEGCRLRVMTEREWEAPYIQQGEAICFPTWTPHRVTPIERGVRYALAIWVHGPQFR
jgi:PKHD-type hydroxylase